MNDNMVAAFAKMRNSVRTLLALIDRGDPDFGDMEAELQVTREAFEAAKVAGKRP